MENFKHKAHTIILYVCQNGQGQ